MFAEGTQYSGEAIENMSLIEAIPNENNIMRSRLITLERGTSVIPFINIGTDIIKVAIGGTFRITPRTINFNGVSSGLVETNGYSFTIADVRLVNTFQGQGATAPKPSGKKEYSSYSTTALSETVVGNVATGAAITADSLFGSNTKLLTTMTIEGNNTGARLTVPFELSKTRTITSAAESEATPSESV